MRSLSIATQILTLGFSLLAVSLPASAHHSFQAEYDQSKPLTLVGKVTRVVADNPHGWIYLDAKNEQGKVVNWAIECGSPNTMFRRGLNKDSLPVGTEINVDGYLAKDGENKANGRDVTLTDGRKLFLGSSNPDADK